MIREVDKKEIILNQLKGLYLGQSSNNLKRDLKEDILSQMNLEFEFIDIEFNECDDILCLITDEGKFVFLLDYYDDMDDFAQYEIEDIEICE